MLLSRWTLKHTKKNTQKQLDEDRNPKLVYLVTKISDRKELIRIVIQLIKNKRFTSYINREMYRSVCYKFSNSSLI